MRTLRLLVFLVAALVAAAAGLARAQERQIVVTGSGFAEAAPDMAVITLGVTEQAAQARAAMQASSESAGRILARLEEMGVAARDIQTGNLSLRPVWRNRGGQDGPPEITGYVASNRLNVRVRDLERLGAVLDAVLGDGANDFGGLRFSVAEPSAMENAARAGAVADAMEKASQLAAAAGIALGPVQSISEQLDGPRPQLRMAEMAMADAAVPVAPGEVSVSVSVTMVFAIGE